MKLIFTIFCCICIVPAFSQKELDTRIIIQLSDTSNIYERIRMAFVNSDFVVKDDRKKDTISTYPYNIKSNSFMHAFAAIKGREVEIWGYLGYTKVSIIVGFTDNPSKKKDYKPVYYYRGDKYWRKLMDVAIAIGGKLTYLK